MGLVFLWERRFQTMEDNYPLTELHTELAEIGISTELSEDERKNQEFIQWDKKQKQESDRQLIRNILENVGINPNGNIDAQLNNY